MTDYSELRRLAERYDIPDDAFGRIEYLMRRELKAENEALRKDAERYRSMFTKADGFDYSDGWVGHDKDEVDVMIDTRNREKIRG